MLSNINNVFIVGGNRLLRETLARLLSKREDLSVSGISPPASSVADSIISSSADLLILDSATLRMLNCAFIPEMVHRIPHIKVVLIDMDADPEVFLKCVRAGALGYLLMDASAAEVVSGVCDVARGHAVCPSSLCFHLFRAYLRSSDSISRRRVNVEIGLTRRQLQLVPLISKGLTNKEIGSHLGISEQTVKNHIHQIMRRVGVNDRLSVSEVVGETRSLRVAQ